MLLRWAGTLTICAGSSFLSHHLGVLQPDSQGAQLLRPPAGSCWDSILGRTVPGSSGKGQSSTPVSTRATILPRQTPIPPNQKLPLEAVLSSTYVSCGRKASSQVCVKAQPKCFSFLKGSLAYVRPVLVSCTLARTASGVGVKLMVQLQLSINFHNWVEIYKLFLPKRLKINLILT